MSIEAPTPGDWIEIEFGSTRCIFYVVDADENIVRLGSLDWLSSSTTTLTIKDINKRAPIYLGRGEKRKWWRFMPLRSCFCPFEKPNRLWWV